jgi:hypothetical protein
MALAAGARQRLYERHKPAVLCVLARRGSFLVPLDRESAYHDAYLTLCEKQAARSGGSASIADHAWIPSRWPAAQAVATPKIVRCCRWLSPSR